MAAGKKLVCSGQKVKNESFHPSNITRKITILAGTFRKYSLLL